MVSFTRFTLLTVYIQNKYLFVSVKLKQICSLNGFKILLHLLCHITKLIYKIITRFKLVRIDEENLNKYFKIYTKK